MRMLNEAELEFLHLMPCLQTLGAVNGDHRERRLGLCLLGLCSLDSVGRKVRLKQVREYLPGALSYGEEGRELGPGRASSRYTALPHSIVVTTHTHSMHLSHYKGKLKQCTYIRVT